MVNKLTEAIAAALDNEFSYPVFIDEIEQSMPDRCFLVTPIVQPENHIVMNRYERQYSFMIQYFPSDQRVYRTECNTVSEKMYDVLELITASDGNRYRGEDKSPEIVDGVLNFSVTFKGMFIKKHAPLEKAELMETLEQDMNVKE